MAGDFLAENSICGQALLQIVSQGNAILAELLQLKDFVPAVFKKGSKDNVKFDAVLSNFSYFQSSDSFERNIDHNKNLSLLDEQFRLNYQGIVTRFYLLLEAVHRYVANLQVFLENLESGLFVQQTLEILMDHDEARQLMCEALWLYGTSLLLVDIYIEGEIREQLLVAYYRHSADSSSVEDVCRLFRSTGFSTGKKKPGGYPEEYFSREHLPKSYIDHVVGTLRSADIYNQTSAFPHPEHRTAALSTQAGMLIICLFFAPEMLSNQPAKMREIVDRFLPDNWITCFHLGLCLNLVEWWQPYSAAKSALANTVEVGCVTAVSKRHADALQKLSQQTKVALNEQMFLPEFLLENSNRIFRLLRECNVTLRWLIIHQLHESKIGENTKPAQKLRATVASQKVSSEAILDLILNTAELELKVRETLESLLEKKSESMDKLRRDCQSSFGELAEVYSGRKPLTRLERNEKLSVWFTDMSSQIDGLDVTDPSSCARKLTQILRVIEEVQELSQVESHPHIRQYMLDIQSTVKQMIRLLDLSDRRTIALQMISDFSYVWGDHVSHFIPKMQALAKKDPSVISRLRATFLKLAAAMEQPLLRINQAGSDDLVAVSTFYSKDLESVVRKVLYVVPETMVSLLEEIIQIQTGLRELPTRLEKEKQKEFSQLDDRFKVAQLTHRVSQLSAGVLAMKSTLIGVINLDPRQLLEDGIRRELVRQIATVLHRTLNFNAKTKTKEIYEKIHDILDAMNGFRRSFEYIQDYVGFHGLKIINEELTRVICYLFEQETNSFRKVQIQDWQSKYQSRAVPVPKLSPTDAQSVTAMGRLVREMIRITDPKSTLFLNSEMTWFDQRSHGKVLEMRLFEMIHGSVSTVGLSGVERLLGVMIDDNFAQVKRRLDVLSSDRGWKEVEGVIRKDLSDGETIDQPSRHYGNLVGKAVPHLQGLSEAVSSIGQLQLLQQCCSFQLNLNSRYNAKNLVSALENLEMGMLNDIRHEAGAVNATGQGMNEVNELLLRCGMTDPLLMRYSSLEEHKELPFVLSMLTLAMLPKLTYSKQLGAIMAKRTGDLDGYPFLVGLSSLLRHSNGFEHIYFSYLSQFLTSNICAMESMKMIEVPGEVLACGAIIKLIPRLGKTDENKHILSFPQISIHL